MKKKLRIESLKVQSFVTELKNESTGVIGGGATQVCTLKGLPTTECFSGYYPSINAPCPILCH